MVLAKSVKNQTFVTNRGRFVLGAFVFAWLTAAAQPCLMAMEMVAEPAEALAQPGHDMHHASDEASHHDASRDCGHCPPIGEVSGQSTCVTIQVADCDNLSGANVDARQLKFKLKDVPGMFAIPQAPPQAISFRPTSASAPPTGVRYRFCDGPSLNLRFCVFLK